MLLVKQPIKRFQSGAALVEFAIILPLLLLLVLGICEFGYAFYHLNILNKSVQDGARYFSDPQYARKGATNGPINVLTNDVNITNTNNLVIYGNTSGTVPQLLPESAPVPTVNCVNVNGQITSCTATPLPQHIMVTATYNHNFILGNALHNLTAGTIPSVYSLTASSVLRVE